jgi:poly(A) polymerase
MSAPSDTCDTALEKGAKSILVTLRQHGHTAFWAGGCVRDRLLGRPPKDIDIATSARPDEIEPLFPRTVPVGKAFGVITVIQDNLAYEVATFRREEGYTDGRHPARVDFTDAREDALRRDFTINALFYDPVDDIVIDYVDGRKDLKRQCIRAVGDPDERFKEDHLRMLRAIRFAATLDFALATDTEAAIRRHAAQLRRISAERIRDELTRTFVGARQPGDTLHLLLDTGLLAAVLPEVAALAGVEQPAEFHPEGDVFVHTALMLNLLGPPPRSEELVWAVLLHDIGKPLTQRWGAGADGRQRIRFDGHDRAGADLADDLLARLKFSNHQRQIITHCVRNHMRFMHVQEMRKAKLRAMIGAPTFPLELELHRVDCLSSHGAQDNYAFLRAYQQQLAEEPALPPAWIRGQDLLALGLPRGPAIGHWLRQAYTRQLEGDAQDRQALLQWLQTEIAQSPTPDTPVREPPKSNTT